MLLPRDLQKRVNSGGICVSRDEQEMSLPNPFRSEFVPVVFKVEANSNLLQIAFNTPTTIHLTVNLFASALHQRIYSTRRLTVGFPSRTGTMAETRANTATSPPSASKRPQANPKESGKKAIPSLR
jgi:hypothetical protein